MILECALLRIEHGAKSGKGGAARSRTHDRERRTGLGTADVLAVRAGRWVLRRRQRHGLCLIPSAFCSGCCPAWHKKRKKPPPSSSSSSSKSSLDKKTPRLPTRCITYVSQNTPPVAATAANPPPPSTTTITTPTTHNATNMAGSTSPCSRRRCPGS